MIFTQPRLGKDRIFVVSEWWSRTYLQGGAGYPVMWTEWRFTWDWYTHDTGLPTVCLSQPSGGEPRPAALGSRHCVKWVNSLLGHTCTDRRTRILWYSRWVRPYVIMSRLNWLSRWVRHLRTWGYKSIPHRWTPVHWQPVGSHWLPCMSQYTCRGQLWSNIPSWTGKRRFTYLCHRSFCTVHYFSAFDGSSLLRRTLISLLLGEKKRIHCAQRTVSRRCSCGLSAAVIYMQALAGIHYSHPWTNRSEREFLTD